MENRKGCLLYTSSGTNLLTFAKDVKLWDPEINSTDGRGYPLMRTANFGVNINF